MGWVNGNNLRNNESGRVQSIKKSGSYEENFTNELVIFLVF